LILAFPRHPSSGAAPRGAARRPALGASAFSNGPLARLFEFCRCVTIIPSERRPA